MPAGDSYEETSEDRTRHRLGRMRPRDWFGMVNRIRFHRQKQSDFLYQVCDVTKSLLNVSAFLGVDGLEMILDAVSAAVGFDRLGSIQQRE